VTVQHHCPPILEAKKGNPPQCINVTSFITQNWITDEPSNRDHHAYHTRDHRKNNA
ncbi:hypothetical protein G9A89_016626, partial [Geosiphon pyriformis]